jgi:hypothetical protein
MPSVAPPGMSGPQVQYAPGRNQAAYNSAPQSGPILPPAPQQPVAVAAQQQIGTQAQIPPGTMVVPRQGPVEVQVFDENGKYLGTEIIDAQGNVTNPVTPPAFPSQPGGTVTQNPPTGYIVPPTRMNYPQTPVLPVSGGGWMTRSQAR